MSVRHRYLPMLPVLLAGCVFLPETTTIYNAECATYERHTTLSVQQAVPFMSCRGEGCATALVFSGIVSAASMVVSGSVVISENLVSWLERKRSCAPPAHAPHQRSEARPADQ